MCHERGNEIVRALESNELDVGVICPPKRVPKTLRVTHSFDDAFTLIASPEIAATFPADSKPAALQAWAETQNWLLFYRPRGPVVGTTHTTTSERHINP
jgi:hypothetical protein